MNPDPSRRIGFAKTSDVRRHEYFLNMDWKGLVKKDFVPLARRYNRFLRTPEPQDAGEYPSPFRNENMSLNMSDELNVQGWNFNREDEVDMQELCDTGIVREPSISLGSSSERKSECSEIRAFSPVMSPRCNHCNHRISHEFKKCMKLCN